MNKKSALEWLESAKADLKNIEHILQDDFLTHIVAFHSQQCVEKCFKSILEHKADKVHRSHSTLMLYGAIKNIVKINVNTDILTDLDDLYISSRYPGDLGLLPNGKPTLEDAKEFYDFAKSIYNQVCEILDKI